MQRIEWKTYRFRKVNWSINTIDLDDFSRCRIVGGIETLSAMEAIPTDGKDRPQSDILIEDTIVFVNPYTEVDEQVGDLWSKNMKWNVRFCSWNLNVNEKINEKLTKRKRMLLLLQLNPPLPKNQSKHQRIKFFDQALESIFPTKHSKFLSTLFSMWWSISSF